jgi:holo-[acyl-carrier protein] synthase
MIGLDLVSIGRIEKFIARFGEKGLEKFLSAEEIALVKSPKTAAGFWAVKEAVAKALGCGIGAELGFHDIIITKTPKNAPMARLSEKAALYHGVETIAVSITHDGGFAAAVAFIKKSQ